MQNPAESQPNLSRIHENLNKTYGESIIISTEPRQNPSESQQNLSRIHHNLNKTQAESIRISTKSVQNPSESQQNLCRIHENLNKIYANPIRRQDNTAKTIQPKTQADPSEVPAAAASELPESAATRTASDAMAKCHRVKSGKMPQSESFLATDSDNAEFLLIQMSI